MTSSPLKSRLAAVRLLLHFLGVAVTFAALSPGAWAGPQSQELPGPLSVGHAETPGPHCQSCHGSDMKIAPSKCLACHQEIARQQSAPKGFHRDKAEGCADCHAEHQGAGKSLIPLDVKDFDHSETGTVLSGPHRKVTDCGRCHRPENSYPRAKTRSYIMKASGCQACHHSPHPGRQDDCLACHTPETWTIDRLNGRK